MGKIKYNTEEERKEADRAKWRKFYYKHREERIEYSRMYKSTHSNEIAKYKKERAKTPIGRATMLLCAYNREDKKYGRGKGDLTAQWIVENIFSKPCKCGKSGWQIIGCNRIDNSKPHTKDNVEPCCGECNVKLNDKHGGKRVDQIDEVTGEIIYQWQHAQEAATELGFQSANINKAARNVLKTYKDYIWKRPL